MKQEVCQSRSMTVGLRAEIFELSKTAGRNFAAEENGHGIFPAEAPAYLKSLADLRIGNPRGPLAMKSLADLRIGNPRGPLDL